MDASTFSSRTTLLSASRAEIRLVAVSATIVIVIQALVLAADTWWGIDHYDLVRDPNAIAGNPHYFGMISNIGVVLWIGAAAGALQAFAALSPTGRGNIGDTLFYGGMFAALMGIDDLFMLHESVQATGMPEPVVLIPHALLLMMLCYHAWRIRYEMPWRTLAVAVLAFGFSMAVDLYPGHMPGQVFIEESFKLLGIAMLASYLIFISHKALKQASRI